MTSIYLKNIKNVEKHIWLNGTFSYICEVDMIINGVLEEGVKYTSAPGGTQPIDIWILQQIESGNIIGEINVIDNNINWSKYE